MRDFFLPPNRYYTMNVFVSLFKTFFGWTLGSSVTERHGN